MIQQVHEAFKSGHLSEAASVNIEAWLSEPKYQEYRTGLEQMITDQKWQELEDAFYTVIVFGTGGRRGITGIGSNRINRVTMGESAQALCEYAKSFDPEAPQKGIAIACDTRLTSVELSQYCASVCAANGYKTYIFSSFRATPELSFAVRQLGCAAGIVVSASHNPPTDNGFKAYWADGGQLVPPHDKALLEVADRVREVKSTDYQAAVDDSRIIICDDQVDEAYISAVINESVGTERNLDIVYSPLHGAGQTSVLPVLQRAGFTNVSTVEAQMVPDGNFPTVPGGKANPEEPKANDMAVEQLMHEKADIAITNDPDADRIGVVVRHGEKPVYLNGNQLAVLAADYVLGKLSNKGELSQKHYIGKTIVTTDMLDALAASYGCQVYGNMLIGFKYIGELILKKEGTDETFVLGGEESYGLLKGTYARDKDGAIGALLLAEYAAELKASGKTLFDRMLELYEEHGLYLERLDTVVCPGAAGFELMQATMARLRENPPARIGDYEVTAMSDYISLKRTDLKSSNATDIDCMSGNVLVYELNGDSRCRITIRPSGTEPKLKFYTQWYEPATGGVLKQYEQLAERITELAGELDSLVLK